MNLCAHIYKIVDLRDLRSGSNIYYARLLYSHHPWAVAHHGFARAARRGAVDDEACVAVRNRIYAAAVVFHIRSE